MSTVQPHSRKLPPRQKPTAARRFCGGVGGVPGPCPENKPKEAAAPKNPASLNDVELASHLDSMHVAKTAAYEKASKEKTPENIEAFFKANQQYQDAQDESDKRERAKSKKTSKATRKPSIPPRVSPEQEKLATELASKHTLAGMMRRIDDMGGDSHKLLNSHKALPTESKARREAETKIIARELAAKITGQKNAERFSESSTVPAVEIFAAGTHRGKSYTESDLDDIVRNFNAASVGPNARLEVPVVIGHEEKQDYLEDTGIPAAGWLKRVWRKGTKLMADIGDMPAVVTKLLRANRYKHVSAEIYDDPPNGVQGKGCTLRRIALLGGEQPQVKNLANIPLPDLHSEQSIVYRPCVLKFCEIKPGATAGVFRVFSEVVPMDRDQMVQQLADMGFDVEKLKDCPDEALAEILRGITAGGEGEGGEVPTEGGDAQMSDDADADDKDKTADMSDDEKSDFCSKYLEGMPDDARAKFLERYMAKNADDNGAADNEPAPKKVITTTAEHFSEKKLNAVVAELSKRIDQQITAAVATIAKQFAPIKEDVEGVKRFNEQTAAENKKATTKNRLDSLVQQGKVLPAEVEGLTQTALALDATKVQKFSEKGKEVSRTQYDNFFATLDARPFLQRFGERIPGGTSTTSDAEAEKCRRFAESDGEFNRTLAIQGKTPDHYVADFEACRKKMPGLTAKAFGVPAEYCRN